MKTLFFCTLFFFCWTALGHIRVVDGRGEFSIRVSPIIGELLAFDYCVGSRCRRLGDKPFYSRVQLRILAEDYKYRGYFQAAGIASGMVALYFWYIDLIALGLAGDSDPCARSVSFIVGSSIPSGIMLHEAIFTADSISPLRSFEKRRAIFDLTARPQEGDAVLVVDDLDSYRRQLEDILAELD